ncbi:MAG TPA: DUF5615 family PIN-like protein [Candidatus Dormibacteraeota bacterium]|nr:DUF5615 family PIN-like protein [Candidatus Dormibacteraeota bacterium]
MRLLLDEMFPSRLAERLRAAGHDVASLHEPSHRALEGAPDEDVWVEAVAGGWGIVTENVADFRRLEAAALGAGERVPTLIYTTNRQFPRGDPSTFGRLVAALTALLDQSPGPTGQSFFKASP